MGMLQLSRRPARLGHQVLPIRHTREAYACMIYVPALSRRLKFEQSFIRGAQSHLGMHQIVYFTIWPDTV